MQKKLRWTLTITLSPAVFALLVWSSLFMSPLLLTGGYLPFIAAAAVLTSLLVGYCAATAALVTADYIARK